MPMRLPLSELLSFSFNLLQACVTRQKAQNFAQVYLNSSQKCRLRKPRKVVLLVCRGLSNLLLPKVKPKATKMH